MERLKKVKQLKACEIAAIEPVGSKRFVPLKKVFGGKGTDYEITHRG